MCALQKRAAPSVATALRAKEGLEALLRRASPLPSELSIAVEALETLKLDLEGAQRARVTLCDATSAAAAHADTTRRHTERVESEIIGAKLEAGELLTERDRLARDLARARRTLGRSDQAIREMREAKGGGDMLDEEEDARLGRGVAQEFERMSVAENALIDVVEEIGKVRKRREELQEKLKMAQEEW